MKKLISLALCGLILCCTATTTVFGENEGVVPNANSYVEARYAEFSMVYASLSKTSLGFYHVEGSAGTYDNDLRVDITLTIEGCNSSGNYVPIDGFKWTASDYYAAATQATRALSGGAYRAHTVAKCYRNGVLLETVEAYSDVVNVPF